MKKLLYILSSIAVLGILAVSCDLTEDPQAVAGRAIVFGDEAGLRNYTYGFYNYLPDYGGAHKINITHDHSAKMNTGTYEQGAYTTSTSTSWSWSSLRNVNYFIKYNTDPNVPTKTCIRPRTTAMSLSGTSSKTWTMPPPTSPNPASPRIPIR